MYLTREAFIWHSMVTKNTKITGFKGIKFNPQKVDTIKEEAIYWRKANSIHKWFVKNVQGGKDDCEKYPVERPHLEALLKDINDVLSDKMKASLILPTGNGFFFGGIDYDSYYFNTLKRTRKELEKILKNWNDRWSYHYRSSW